MRRLRLLWVTPHLPRRGVNAARERWWALLDQLARRHRVTLLAFADPDEAGQRDAVPPGLEALEIVERAPWAPDDPLSRLPRPVRWGFAHPRFAAAVRTHLDSGRYDLAQFEYTEMAHLMPVPRIPTILTVHQLLFASVRPAWRAAGGGIGPAVRALHQYVRELDFELRALARAHHVVTMSPEDAARLRRFLPSLAVSVSPCGVDCAAFAPSGAPGPARADVLFVGHFGHPPNVDAATFLVREVLPRVGRPLRVRIVGHAPTPAVTALAGPGVEVVGPVADVRPELAAARIVVAPVRFGTGMRGKVLEALAAARPVVTTTLGAEGLGATSGRHLLVADDAPAFAAALRHICDDAALAQRLADDGRRLVEAQFDWAAIAAAHEQLYDSVLRDPGRPVRVPVDRAAPLAALARRTGRTAGAGLGFALLASRALRWHARTLGRPRARLAPAPALPLARRSPAS